ncbi:hypothetical protein [Oscillatoria sp. FACHB-1406]|uniref:hypothetical protein n=1 Tax=Oscillatoria sp. FACHB-1406 TaxID=2692846 RepID=UPI001683F69C|nr:hypothetical protein [Oscillatoria sp. FACHB-1406]MBD2580028.1 hypothetical protein [Oscillatoria sp. FACHB-1406]
MTAISYSSDGNFQQQRDLVPRALHDRVPLRANPRSCPSVCRCCRYYQFQGRSSGYCCKLSVSVRGCWHSCPFALQPFASF